MLLNLIATGITTAILFFSSHGFASSMSIDAVIATPFIESQDPDLEYIIEAIKNTPCSEVQILVARNVAAIYWNQQNYRFLYGQDIEPLHQATLSSGKRVILVDKDFDIPKFGGENWGARYDQFVKDITEIFREDYLSHPPQGC